MSLFICVLWWNGVRAQVPLDAGFLRVRGGPVGLWAVDGSHRWRMKGEAASPREASVSVGFGAGMAWILAGSVGVEVAPYTWLSSGLEWGPRHRGMWRVEVHRHQWGRTGIDRPVGCTGWVALDVWHGPGVGESARPGSLCDRLGRPGGPPVSRPAAAGFSSVARSGWAVGMPHSVASSMV